MKLTTFRRGAADHVGVLREDSSTLVDLTAADPTADCFASMQQLIAAGDHALERAADLLARSPRAADLALADVRLLAPLPRPVRLRDCTLFTEHLEPGFRAVARQQSLTAQDPEAEFERLMATGMYDLPQVLRDQPVYYNADPLSVSGPDDQIVAPRTSTNLDYELEFAVVVGRDGIDVTEAEAADHIFGYTIYNDWSLRDVQSVVMRSNLGPAEGKDFDGGTTLGPVIVTADELGDPYDLQMSASVNGERWSSGTSASMTHSFEGLLAHLSRGKRLYAGEVLGSGTVLSGSGFELGRSLADGDVVELTVEGIGTLRNTVHYAASA